MYFMAGMAAARSLTLQCSSLEVQDAAPCVMPTRCVSATLVQVVLLSCRWVLDEVVSRRLVIDV